jgi:cytoskeleton protein RodZ
VVETPVSTTEPENLPTAELDAEAEPALAEEVLGQEDSLMLEEEPVEEVAIVEDGLDNFELASVQADGTDSVVLRFNKESWAEVFDANGVQLLRGLMKSGTVQQLSGTAPFSVFLGNTPAVEIRINDVEFDASPYMRRDSVSRFTLKAP